LEVLEKNDSNPSLAVYVPKTLLKNFT